MLAGRGLALGENAGTGLRASTASTIQRTDSLTDSYMVRYNPAFKSAITAIIHLVATRSICFWERTSTMPPTETESRGSRRARSILLLCFPIARVEPATMKRRLQRIR